MEPKTENPPKLKLPKKIKQRPEEAYPVKWAFNAGTRKVVKLTNKDEESKYDKKIIFTEYKKALEYKEFFLANQVFDAKRVIKRYQKILTMFHGELLLAKEELRNIL